MPLDTSFTVPFLVNGETTAGAMGGRDVRGDLSGDGRDGVERGGCRGEHRAAELLEASAADAGWCELNVAYASGVLRRRGESDVTVLVLKEPYGVVLSIAPWSVLHPRGACSPPSDDKSQGRAGDTRGLRDRLPTGRGQHRRVQVVGAVAAHALPGGRAVPDSRVPRGDGQPVGALARGRAAHHGGADPGACRRIVNFTGSTATGRRIAALASEHLKPVTLELGSEAPTIVFDDNDAEAGDPSVRRLRLQLLPASGLVQHATAQFTTVEQTFAVRKFLLERILRTFPRRRFMLIGDTSNPDIMSGYPEVAKAYANVQCILLRNVSATDSSNRFPYDTSGFNGLDRAKYMFFTTPDDLAGLDFGSGDCANAPVVQSVIFGWQNLPLGVRDQTAGEGGSSSGAGVEKVW